jgi:hypothetical protein
MKRAEVDLFEKIAVQLDGFHEELTILVKKSPNDAVNQFKLNFINDVLRQCNQLLGEKYRPFPEFEIFSLDDMPSNSDVSFILSQYIECAEKFRGDNIHMQGIFWVWKLDEGEVGSHTSSPSRPLPPKKIRRGK